jgi:hypothetical protein
MNICSTNRSQLVGDKRSSLFNLAVSDEEKINELTQGLMLSPSLARVFINRF